MMTDSMTTDSMADATGDAVADSMVADSTGDAVADSTVADATGDAIADSMVDAPDTNPANKQVIIFVWDGTRYDSTQSATNTPTLAGMRTGGVEFQDNHSTYPTFTMMNGSSFATGSFPKTAGFYGNTVMFPIPGQHPTGNQTTGAAMNFSQSVFTEDAMVLQDMQTYYASSGGLLMVPTLFATAQAAGLKTAAVGKAGPAFLQDINVGAGSDNGVMIDETIATPPTFVAQLLDAGLQVPIYTPNFPGFADAGITIPTLADGGIPDPTLQHAPAYIDLSAYGTSTTDPTAVPTAGSSGFGNRYAARNQYLVNVFVNQILAVQKPNISLIWLRNPDATEHDYGPGTAMYLDALKQQDALLAQIKTAAPNADIIVVSDHGHSSVGGPIDLFPRRSITAGTDINPSLNAAATDSTSGYSVSGYVRLADLLTTNGFTAYDGSGCVYDPIMSGVLAAGAPVHAAKTAAAGDGSGCTSGSVYTFPSYVVPATPAAGTFIVAANGGSDYVYLEPSGTTATDQASITSVVAFMEKREEIGAIFVDSKWCGTATASDPCPNVPGALPMSDVNVQGHSRNPDIVFSYTWDQSVSIAGMPGIEFQGVNGKRGMHGSFSPYDVHNTLVAMGPDFKSGYADTFPSGNVDVAPTVAKIFGLSLSQADGRVLVEALTGSTDNPSTPATSTITGATVSSVTETRADNSTTRSTSYTGSVSIKTITVDTKTYTYFDQAKATRP
jgi:hypothetical protein